MFSWVSRFISNCRINNTQETKQGPIVTEDIVAQLLKIIKQYQLEFNLGGDFQKESLNLQMHELVCVSWQNQGRLSIIYTKDIIASITVGWKSTPWNLTSKSWLTTTKIRSQFWIQNYGSWHRQSFIDVTTPFRRPTTGELPKGRSEGYRPFLAEAAGFAGSITYKIREKKEGKV